MPDERCKHELPVAQCTDCAPVPQGLTGRVITTKGGQVFHQTDRCGALKEGQRHADRLGLEIHPPVNVPLSTALGEGRAACENCFPDYHPGKADKAAHSARQADVDHVVEAAAALTAASRAVAAALAAHADRRRLTDVVAAALLDIRAQVWPNAPAPVRPRTPDRQHSDRVQ